MKLFLDETNAALPPDVRKGLAFPTVTLYSLGATPRIWGVAPSESNNSSRRPEAFRTSGGGAGKIVRSKY